MSGRGGLKGFSTVKVVVLWKEILTFRRVKYCYLCNTIVSQFLRVLLGPSCCYGNGIELLKDSLKLNVWKMSVKLKTNLVTCYFYSNFRKLVNFNK